MQFSKVLLLSMAAAGVAAAPSVVTKRDVSSDVVTAINNQEPALQKDYAAINKLTNSSSQAEVSTALTNLNTDLKPLVSQLQSLAAQAKNVQPNTKRATDLELAVTRLVTELNAELPRIFPIVTHLTTDLGLSSVTALVQALEPTLYALVAAVEALLLTLAPGLSGLVDPLLTGVVALLAGLGINLDGNLIAQLGLDSLINQLGLVNTFTQLGNAFGAPH